MKFLLLLLSTCLQTALIICLESEAEPEIVITHPDKGLEEIRYGKFFPAPFTGGEHIGLTTKWYNCSIELPPLQEGDLIEFERKIFPEVKIRKIAHSLLDAVLKKNPLLGKIVSNETLEKVKEDIGFEHWAIYSGIENGKQRIITYQPHSGNTTNLNFDFPNTTQILLKNVKVINQTLQEAIQGSRCRVNNRQDWIDQPFKPEVIIKRALQMSDTHRYNLHDNNCESLARWARNGVRKSMQVIAHFNRVSAMKLPEFLKNGIWGIYNDKCETLTDDVVKYASLIEDKSDDETQGNPLKSSHKNFTTILPTYRPENFTTDSYFCTV